MKILKSIKHNGGSYKRKFVMLNTYIKKKQTQKREIPTDNLSMHLSSLEKQEQNKLKRDRQGKIHMIKAEFNETTIRAKIYRINENKELAL